MPVLHSHFLRASRGAAGPAESESPGSAGAVVPGAGSGRQGSEASSSTVSRARAYVDSRATAGVVERSVLAKSGAANSEYRLARARRFAAASNRAPAIRHGGGTWPWISEDRCRWRRPNGALLCAPRSDGQAPLAPQHPAVIPFQTSGCGEIPNVTRSLQDRQNAALTIIASTQSGPKWMTLFARRLCGAKAYRQCSSEVQGGSHGILIAAERRGQAGADGREISGSVEQTAG